MKPWTEHDPIWERLEEESQFPDYPGIKDLVNEYISRSGALSMEFMGYVSECLSLPPNTLQAFKGNMDRLKFIKYPQAPVDSQGVGPHKDSTGLFTFLAQDETAGLQVLNRNGEWIDAPPIHGSLVVNIQQGFEAITGGVCTATTHRVIVSFLLALILHQKTEAHELGPDYENQIQYPILLERPHGPDAQAAPGVHCRDCPESPSRR